MSRREFLAQLNGDRRSSIFGALAYAGAGFWTDHSEARSSITIRRRHGM